MSVPAKGRRLKYGGTSKLQPANYHYSCSFETTDAGKRRWRLWDLWRRATRKRLLAETSKYKREGVGEQTWSLMADDIREQESNHICLPRRNVRDDERGDTFHLFWIRYWPNKSAYVGHLIGTVPLHLYGYLYGWIWAIRHGRSVRYTFKSEVSRWRHVEAIDSSYR